MKLAIGLNLFRDVPRQTRCAENLVKIASKYTQVSLYNITFRTMKNDNVNFTHLPVLKRHAEDVIPSIQSKIPISKDFFDILAQQDCDYFLFTNSDILISEKLIKLVLKGEYETYSFSRHDVLELNSLQDDIKPFRIEIAGFDVWVIKKQWWLDNRDRFNDYVYGNQCWDVDFTVTMYANSNAFLGNKEFFIAHEKHPLNWSGDTPIGKYNSDLWEASLYYKNWYSYFDKILTRTPYGVFTTPLDNELELEKQYLKCT